MRQKVNILLIISFLVMLLSPFVVIKANKQDIYFTVNGEQFNYEETIILNGRTYIPVRKISELLGSHVIWKGETKEVEVTKSDIHFKLKINQRIVEYNSENYLMDSPAIIKDSRTYAPVRFIAEALHHKVSWDSTTRTVDISQKLKYKVIPGDTLATISEATGVSIDSLLVWNNLSNENILIDQVILLEPVELTAVKASLAIATYSEGEYEWLARIIYSEARDEPFEGLVAVGAVVLNRVESSNFPNTIYDVIFQSGQFSPVTTGKIHEITPDAASYRAAEEALYGTDPVDGALYFFNPRISNSNFFNKKDYVIDIGNHSFYR